MQYFNISSAMLSRNVVVMQKPSGYRHIMKYPHIYNDTMGVKYHALTDTVNIAQKWSFLPNRRPTRIECYDEFKISVLKQNNVSLYGKVTHAFSIYLNYVCYSCYFNTESQCWTKNPTKSRQSSVFYHPNICGHLVSHASHNSLAVVREDTIDEN